MFFPSVSTKSCHENSLGGSVLPLTICKSKLTAWERVMTQHTWSELVLQGTTSRWVAKFLAVCWTLTAVALSLGKTPENWHHPIIETEFRNKYFDILNILSWNLSCIVVFMKRKFWHCYEQEVMIIHNTCSREMVFHILKLSFSESRFPSIKKSPYFH